MRRQSPKCRLCDEYVNNSCFSMLIKMSKSRRKIVHSSPKQIHTALDSSPLSHTRIRCKFLSKFFIKAPKHPQFKPKNSLRSSRLKNNSTVGHQNSRHTMKDLISFPHRQYEYGPIVQSVFVCQIVSSILRLKFLIYNLMRKDGNVNVHFMISKQTTQKHWQKEKHIKVSL